MNPSEVVREAGFPCFVRASCLKPFDRLDRGADSFGDVTVSGEAGLVGGFRRGRAIAGSVLCLGVLAGCGSGGDGGGGDDPSPTASEESSVAGKVIVLDPGHNGGNASHPDEINKQVDVGNGRKACDTSGTNTADGFGEHAFTWDLSNRLAKVLRDRGAEVTLTRENDTGVGPCITERAAFGKRVGADAALSIHGDGAAEFGHGFHVIAPLPVEGNREIVDDSLRLGRDIRDAYRSGTGIPYSTYIGENGLDQRDDLGGLNLATVPKVFIECGNMQNPGDAEKMSSTSFRQRMADSLAKGLERYFGQPSTGPT
ncbi:N-acetylmuramoyl-L-alanine amidase [Actinomadura sp. KC345]|uniref:N-acetylmuramoyl-L-alanine amidase n=1 Tax=Actinomadura sp. KC345 TaxID=2530371 RepID=UPI00104A4458|nr:N-acetylmuramoyl-L-alanine amidase [Actinomadura sp. KC345]TDC49952.1 N-acetylmuramoyl-L-alanine amidase [Actinomadura sp. KC345]